MSAREGGAALRLYELPAAAILEVLIARVRAFEGGTIDDALAELEHALKEIREDQARCLLECARPQRRAARASGAAGEV